MISSQPPTGGDRCLFESLEARNLFSAVPWTNAIDNDITYGPNGSMHAAWTTVEGVDSNIYYSEKPVGGDWSAPLFISGGGSAGGNISGQWIDIEISPSGLPGIVYYNSYFGRLVYETKNLYGEWITPAWIETSSALYPALTFQGDIPWVSYYYNRSNVSDTKNLRVASMQVMGGWVYFNVDSTGDVGRSTSITTTPNGGIAVAYERTDTGQYKYAYYSPTSQTWTTEVAATTNSGGGHTSITFDGWGQPAISYYDAYNADLMFAYRNKSGGGWLSPRRVSSDKGLYTNLYFDSPRNRFLLTATHPNSDQTFLWTSGTLVGGVLPTFGVSALAADAGKRSAAAFRLDSANRVEIAYLTMSNSSNDLYAWARPGVLQNTPTSMSASPFSSTRIDLDWADNISGESGYRIELSTNSGATFSDIGYVGANVSSFSVTGLSSSTTYTFRVRAFLGAVADPTGYSAYSSNASATTFA